VFIVFELVMRMALKIKAYSIIFLLCRNLLY